MQLTASGARLAGLDLARFLAIAGMIVAHTVPYDQQGPVAGWLVTGNASTLFAVVSGFSVALASRRYLEAGEAWAARAALLARGGCVVAVGLVLAVLQQQAVIVLVYLGVAMWLAVPLLTARRWIVLSVCAVLALVVPVLNWWLRDDLQTISELWSPGFLDLGDPLKLVRAVLLTGTYPALTWLVYLLVGMLLGRAAIASVAAGRATRFAGTLAGAGAVTAFVAAVLSTAALTLLPAAADPGEAQEYGGPTGDATGILLGLPHSGTVLDLLRGLGVSAAVVGLCLLLLALLPRAASLLRPFIAAGAAPLSAYVLHILTLAVIAALASTLPLGDEPWWVAGWGAALLNIAIVSALGALLAVFRVRGPFEIAVSRAAAAAGRSATQARADRARSGG
ncbi:heparan-alpha-glucosaminide N-acetyltransferase domain-containing protein [Leifsonia sp. F6_8S_P_1B]|uniref:Heparan-alpha-glucosaminide N-acetyltransferase domain-containing protein n=1 Tax=Leifsonia williamsii TaxID=3035919 RepID=A0ABT8K7H4_9MICO|nr:heparan-alpha-glucosaminide N-acetyltransferase domain-containing protein [Leifsonia williamsii]MDN4613406.1 heparan-alpha-glucosaminide N-acetyltransferase domain-containing protein [Leifsonia williamsii]